MNFSFEEYKPIRFQGLNESGAIQKLTGKGLNEKSKKVVYQFEYANHFYGSCNFTASVSETEYALMLDESSFTLEDHRINKGNLPALVSSAKTFYRTILCRYNSLDQLETVTPAINAPSSPLVRFLSQKFRAV